jgi:ABC-2 type transport system ATP-binding protein
MLVAMTNVIEVEGLRKEYRRLRGGTHVAVEGLDLEVPEGGVYGFLGPNGSGKTTTIRCLLGLSRASAGSCTVLGQSSPRQLHKVIDDVGAIVESPALFPTFSGQRNLRLLARSKGISNAAVDQALERVGLADRADDAVKAYSLGMRQRLGIAAALVKDPALLILDEPVNGLDPAGIVEMRDLLRSLGAEGRTVFVSSHLLSEIEQTCDRVAILVRGRHIASGTVAEVLASATAGAAAVLVKVDDLDAGGTALAAAGMPVERVGEQLRVTVDPARAAEITRVLAESGQWVSELRPVEHRLEDVFLQLTGEPREVRP